ncbi:MAG: glycosyltransferase family 9 protein, partial [Thermodesulfobacteriota bacterium]|nr:glycosyltransferase family 9 protein [Thermodesulfobacteriota bacterium]
MSEKILVVHQGALGDVILSLPALQSLKEERNASVALLCQGQVGRMAQESGVVDAHFPVESARFCGLFSRHMDHNVRDFVGAYETVLLIGFSQELEGTIKGHYGGAVYRIPPRPPLEEETHVALHLASQLQRKGLLRNRESAMAPRTSCLACPAKELDKDGGGKEMILIHPGAGSRRKRWPLENFMAVAAATSKMPFAEVAFVMGPAEADLLPVALKQAGGKYPVHQLEDLSRVTALMNTSKCFLGNDSGLTHLAAFKGLPTVSVFGPSDPKRWRPVGEDTTVLRGEADCIPCFELARKNCDNPQCLHGV